MLITILVVTLLVVYYLLGTAYLKEKREQENLVAQIAAASRTLADIPPAPTDLGKKLSAARESLEAAESVFPGRLNSTAAINTILRLADDVGIKAVPLVTQPWSTESASGYAYSVFRLNMKVTGTFAQLSDFLGRLENGEMETLVIEYMTLERLTGPSGEFRTTGNTMPVNAWLDVAIFSRPPPSASD